MRFVTLKNRVVAANLHAAGYLTSVDELRNAENMLADFMAGIR